MAELQELFDATKINPDQGGSQLPVGKHKVIISDSSIDEIGNKKGGCIRFKLKVVEGPLEGITGDWQLNKYYIGDNAEKVREIADRDLSKICHVTGVFAVNDTRQLHNIPFIVDVTQQKGEGKEKYTEIKKVFDVNGNEPGKAPQQPAQNQAPGQTTQNAPQTGWQQNQPQTQVNTVAPNSGWNQSAQAMQPSQTQTNGGWNSQPAGNAPGWAQNK